MIVIGIDLSGPVNVADTCMVAFALDGGRLRLAEALHGADDRRIFERVSHLSNNRPVVIGIDAPLSYNLGGGDRPADAALRRRLIALGLQPGSIMPPTMQRMAYLTLRGISLSRCLETLRPDRQVSIVEVHPGASLALRQAPLQDVLQLKKSAAARKRLLSWLARQGLQGIAAPSTLSDHYVAACAAALAAWNWQTDASQWCMPAQPPHHPYDFAG